MTYQLLADFPKALGCFGEIIVSFPTYKRMNIVALRSSILLTQQGQFGRAAQYLEYILESPPEKYDQHDIIFMLGRIYEIQNRRQEANGSYQELHRRWRAEKHAGNPDYQWGKFQSWQSWYKSAETWEHQALRFLHHLKDPLFAADAATQALRRDQARPKSWIILISQSC